MITLAALHGAGVGHAFFGREGGVSDGLFASLNCGFGSGDTDESVARNRVIAMARLGVHPETLVTCRQIHSTTVVAVDRVWQRAQAPRADGMVTGVPGLALGVLAADCAPILLHDPVAKVVGVAHGGWRGALGGIVEAVIDHMEAIGADRTHIHAGIGPCIGAASYEVGPEFPQAFLDKDRDAGRFFSPAQRAAHFMFDLGGYLDHRLATAGVATRQRALNDTVLEEDRFFSYRRACLRGEPSYGRALSMIVLLER